MVSTPFLIFLWEYNTKGHSASNLNFVERDLSCNSIPFVICSWQECSSLSNFLFHYYLSFPSCASKFDYQCRKLVLFTVKLTTNSRRCPRTSVCWCTGAPPTSAWTTISNPRVSRWWSTKRRTREYLTWSSRSTSKKTSSSARSRGGPSWNGTPTAWRTIGEDISMRNYVLRTSETGNKNNFNVNRYILFLTWIYSFKSPDRSFSSENRRSKSFEEREEEYEKARRRIFNREVGRIWGFLSSLTILTLNSFFDMYVKYKTHKTVKRWKWSVLFGRCTMVLRRISAGPKSRGLARKANIPLDSVFSRQISIAAILENW